ncbi:MAG: SMI1/KNR4 family protein [Cytophagales bacterium]|nr:SMI1/KNR4 family protein [Cytophagales bacterium]
MRSLINEIRKSKDCVVLQPSGLPTVKLPHILPQDLQEFYTECGGIRFFQNSDYVMEIVTPDNFLLSNPVILSEDWETDIPKDDISNDWYIIAQAGPEQKISIDLNEVRLSRCYDSFWDIHASPGECPIITLSFFELVENIFKCKGGYWFWLVENFKSLGDAYD